MEYANEIWLIVWAFIRETFSNPANLAVLMVAWFAVEVTGGFVRFAISLPSKMTKTTRLKLYGGLQKGKRYGSTCWAALLMWVPYSQPALCGPEMVAGCQTIMSRLSTAVILGLGLAVGHRLIAPRLRKIMGRGKTYRITCSNCRKGVKVASLEDACPQCGEVPHEVTSKE